MWDPRYRALEAGEVIRETDEVLTDSATGWQPAGVTAGTLAPDPCYSSHRLYRRRLDPKDGLPPSELDAMAARVLRQHPY